MTTYNKESKSSSNRCYKKIGFLDDEINKGILDPIAFYKLQAEKLNKDTKEAKIKNNELKIGDRTIKNIGCFLIEGVLNSLNMESIISHYCLENNIDNVYDVLKKLIFESLRNKNESTKNIDDVEDLKVIDFLGANYKDIVALINERVNELYPCENDYCFFDSTKSFFNTTNGEECMSQVILFNKDMVPKDFLSFKEDITNKLTQKEILLRVQELVPNSRIIRLADKGINYGNNIYNALLHNDGYIFPLSLSLLNEAEKDWILNPEEYSSIKDSEGKVLYNVKSLSDDFLIKIVKNDGTKAFLKAKQKRVASFDPELSEKKRVEILKLVDQAKVLFSSNARKQDYGKSLKYVKIVEQDGKEEKIEINQYKIDNELKHAGYKLIVSSETYFRSRELFNIYDTIWRIEDFFKKLKNQLDLNGELTSFKERIDGFYLVNYLTVVAFRILKSKVLKNQLSKREIDEVINGFNVLEVGNEYINLLKPSIYVNKIQRLIKTQFDSQYFKKSEINKLMKMKLK